MRRKKIITAVGVFLLILLYLSIFCLSAENGDNSSRLSLKVTGLIFRILYGGGQKEAVHGAGVNQLCEAEGYIRTLAHFLEYLGVGAILGGILLLWDKSLFDCARWVLIQLVISAILDEFHQYFVPGRYASFRDVLVDTTGGMVGLALAAGLHKIREKRSAHTQK